MEFRYLPMTEADKQDMLKSIGVESTEELFSEIPESVRFKGELNLKKPADETAIMKDLTRMAKRNANLQEYSSFLGAGVYDHYIPSVVGHVVSRSEFYTAYTPYQPEMSQGELQAIFEYQTMICELTGMEVANSSMYDGGTALAEAVTLSAGHTKRKKILVSETVHPETREVLQTHARAQNLDIVEIEHQNGTTDLEKLQKELDEDTAAVAVQHPNFFGLVEPLAEVNDLIRQQKKTMFLVSSNPLSLGYLTPPGELGADIVVGDTQVFGIEPQFGGPHCGYFATKDKLKRKMPGRLVGQTTDDKGERGFVLTLQAREQHIREDKATSNICSNQALNALASSVALSSIGKNGLKQMAVLNMQKARYAKQQLSDAGFEITFTGPFFNEFVISVPNDVSAINKRLLDSGLIGGYDLGQAYTEFDKHMLVAVTENRSKEEIDTFVKEMRDICG